jgi:hypothetical protein
MLGWLATAVFRMIVLLDLAGGVGAEQNEKQEKERRSHIHPYFVAGLAFMSTIRGLANLRKLFQPDSTFGCTTLSHHWLKAAEVLLSRQVELLLPAVFLPGKFLIPHDLLYREKPLLLWPFPLTPQA